jgi:hypothetical protein
MTNVAKLATVNAEGPTFHDYVAHPLATTFPMIEGTPMEELKADIRNHGILEPIRLYQGMILDGRNRYAAAKFLFAMIGSRRIHLPVAIVSIGREGQQTGRAS